MKKILIAEDDSTMLSLLYTLLEMEGYLPIAYDEEEDIFLTVSRERPDILIMDIHLNDQDGLKVTRRIKQDPVLKDTYVVLQSGMDMEDRSATSGADIFLLKPYMIESLLETLRLASK